MNLLPIVLLFASTLLTTTALRPPSQCVDVSNINTTEDAVLLFDGLSYERKHKLYASIPAFVYDDSVNTTALAEVIVAAFNAYGVTSGYDIDAITDRVGLLAAVGLDDMVPVLESPACGIKHGALPPTDLGMSLGTVELSRCATGHHTGVLSVDASVTNTIYSVSPTGFGVISG